MKEHFIGRKRRIVGVPHQTHHTAMRHRHALRLSCRTRGVHYISQFLRRRYQFRVVFALAADRLHVIDTDHFRGVRR